MADVELLCGCWWSTLIYKLVPLGVKVLILPFPRSSGVAFYRDFLATVLHTTTTKTTLPTFRYSFSIENNSFRL